MSASAGTAARTLEARRIRPSDLDFHRSRIATLRSPRELAGAEDVGALTDRFRDVADREDWGEKLERYWAGAFRA
jgi:hypothetical protein